LIATSKDALNVVQETRDKIGIRENDPEAWDAIENLEKAILAALKGLP
jgi:hypothetical protein